MRKQLLFLLFFTVVVLSTCKKWDLEPGSFPQVITGSYIVDSLLTATLYGEIKGLTGEEKDWVDDHGHLWTDNVNDTILDIAQLNKVSHGDVLNKKSFDFESELPNLAPDTMYWYCSYVRIDNEILYGNWKSFHINASGIEMKINTIIVEEKTNVLIEKVKIDLTFNNLTPGLTIQDVGIVMTDDNTPPSIFNDFFASYESIVVPDSTTIHRTITATVNTNSDQYFWPYMIINGQDFYGANHYFFHAGDIWIRKPDLPDDAMARCGAIGFSIESDINKGYVGTGQGQDSLLDDFHEYNPEMESWDLIYSLPQVPARKTAIGFSIVNIGFVGTGESDENLGDFYEYTPGNPGIGTWKSINSVTGIDRKGAIAFSIDGKGYVGTGANNSLYFDDFYEYTPGNPGIWVSKAPFPGGNRFGAIGFSIDGKGYVGTGANDSLYFDDFYEYTPGNPGIWVSKAPFPGGNRFGAIGFSIDGKGYVGTGFGDGRLDDFWEYDPEMDHWTQKAHFPGGDRQQAIGFSINGKGYVGTGARGGEYFKDFWEYIPE